MKKESQIAKVFYAESEQNNRSKPFKFKKDASIATDDFFYDLFDGGYIRVNDVLDDEQDIKRVNDAIKILNDFRNEAERAGILEYN